MLYYLSNGGQNVFNACKHFHRLHKLDKKLEQYGVCNRACFVCYFAWNVHGQLCQRPDGKQVQIQGFFVYFHGFADPAHHIHLHCSLKGEKDE